MRSPHVSADHLFLRFWRGQLPLAPVFWLLAVLLRGLLWAGTYLLLFRFAYPFLSSAFGIYLIVGWCVLLLPIEFVINVAAWRSASRHGSRTAGRLAKYAVVVLTLMAVSNNYVFMARLKNLNLTRQDIGALNAALPVMVDAGTRLDSVVVRRGVIIFTYTVLGSGTGRIDRAAATRAIRCKPENLALLDAFRTSSSVYKNDAGQIVSAYTVGRDDCGRE